MVQNLRDVPIIRLAIGNSQISICIESPADQWAMTSLMMIKFLGGQL